jgi:hypothetical protein
MSAFNAELDTYLCSKYDIELHELHTLEPELLHQMRSDILFEYLGR